MENETISVSRAETRKRENPTFHKQKMLWPETLIRNLGLTARFQKPYP